LRRAWLSGLHDEKALADLFLVSIPAIRTRLIQTGLVEPKNAREEEDGNAMRFSALVEVRRGSSKRTGRVRRKRCDSMEGAL
jgi:hypothetical protein